MWYIILSFPNKSLYVRLIPLVCAAVPPLSEAVS